jgi:integrase
VHATLADLLVEDKAETAPGAGNCDWLFPSDYGTGRPRWPWTIQRDLVLPAGIRAGMGPIGRHSFRHSYSTLLYSLQVNLKAQQELLRHSDIRTTMNIYTQAVPDPMREAKSRVVEMILPKRKVGSKNEAARAVPRDAKSFQFRPRPSSEVLGESAPK